MPTTAIQRIMFLQGQRCFFCDRTIPKDEASVEHLVPSSTGGSDHMDNLVACCKTLNALFGNISVKEKMRAILKQNGKFICPNQPVQSPPNHAQHQNSPAKAKPAQVNGSPSPLPLASK